MDGSYNIFLVPDRNGIGVLSYKADARSFLEDGTEIAVFPLSPVLGHGIFGYYHCCDFADPRRLKDRRSAILMPIIFCRRPSLMC